METQLLQWNQQQLPIELQAGFKISLFMPALFLHCNNGHKINIPIAVLTANYNVGSIKCIK